MLFKTSQRELLRRILMEIQDQVQYNDTTLDQIGFYLLDQTRPTPLPDDAQLQQCLWYLRELQNADGLQSLRAIWKYMDRRRQHARRFVSQMMDRVDQQRLNGKLD